MQHNHGQDDVSFADYDRNLTRLGFSFSGEVREPFPAVIQALEETKVPVTSVDAPSSWSIEDGPPKSGVGSNFHPAVLVSLTAPKPLVRHFKGRHFIGGR
jgi:NAD(P)H-hydrate epimerase